MKSIIGAFIVALFIVCLALPNMVLAGAEGGSATGSFKFQLDDGATKFVEFTAKEATNGQAEGEMTFTDPSAITVLDPDDSSEKPGEGVLIKAKFDCMKITENRAVMGGEIFDSNVRNAIGLRVLLVIEDNGLDKDRLTWGVYQQPGTWVPTDAEVEDDKGASLVWLATDFERRDDVGVPSNLSKMVSCTTFPLSGYDFPEIKASGGDLALNR